MNRETCLKDAILQKLDMGQTVRVKDLTQAEKLRLFEELWEDLADKDELSSPDWHEAALRETEARVARGEGKFTELSVAMRDLRRELLGEQ